MKNGSRKGSGNYDTRTVRQRIPRTPFSRVKFHQAGQGIESFEHKRLQATTDTTGEYLHTVLLYSSSLLRIEADSSQGRLQSTEYAMHVSEGKMRHNIETVLFCPGTAPSSTGPIWWVITTGQTLYSEIRLLMAETTPGTRVLWSTHGPGPIYRDPYTARLTSPVWSQLRSWNHPAEKFSKITQSVSCDLAATEKSSFAGFSNAQWP